MTKAYKLFRIRKNSPGVLFPLYVLADEPLEMNEWLIAKEGIRLPNNKVHSKLGPLAFRPGFHLCDIPLAVHIGIRENGKIKYMHPETVWAECEYADTFNYQHYANFQGTHDGKFNPRDAFLTYIPELGFYRYKTSPQMLGDWIISGAIKINHVLTDVEVRTICESFGYKAQPRKKPLGFSLDNWP